MPRPLQTWSIPLKAHVYISSNRHEARFLIKLMHLDLHESNTRYFIQLPIFVLIIYVYRT